MADYQLYSKKVEEMLCALAGADGIVFRSIDGELMMSDWSLAKYRIEAITHACDHSVKFMSTDTRVAEVGNHWYTHRELNLLWMMIQKLEDVTTLKSFFGEEMVDAFIGLPKDPLTLGKREVLQNEIKNAEEAYKRKKAIIEALLDSEHNVIQNEYEFQAEPIRAKIQELQETIRKLLDERDKKRFEAESKAETEIKLAKDELDTKRIELRRKLGETVGNC